MSHRACSMSCGSRQRGAALLTAMIIVTLVATLAAAMIWQQWRAVQVESAERDRTQAAWTLSSALQFANLVLRENRPNQYTALTDFWATPLAEGRVSTLNGGDKSVDEDDDSQGFLSGSIEDAQSRYNLLNLVMLTTAASNPPSGGGATAAAKYQVDTTQTPILESLCQAANVDASVAAQIASRLAQAANAGGAGAPLMPETLDQLTWLGLDRASIDALRPYVALFDSTSSGLAQGNKLSVNANTASAAVLSALVSSGAAQTIVQRRQRTPFKTQTELFDTLSLSQADRTTLTPVLNVQSFYFEVNGRLRLTDRVLSQRSLVYRDAQFKVRSLRSERVSSIEQVRP